MLGYLPDKEDSSQQAYVTYKLAAHCWMILAKGWLLGELEINLQFTQKQIERMLGGAISFSVC